MIVFVLMLASLGQQDAEFPFVIVLNNGDRVHAWVDEERLGDSVFPVELDEPWLPPAQRKRTLRGAEVDADSTYRELSVNRDRRIAEGWKAHGGTEVTTRDGTTWIDAEEAEWPRKSEALVSAKQETYRESVTRYSASSSTTTGAAAPSFTELWGSHIAVLTVGLLLAGVAAWFLILQ